MSYNLFLDVARYVCNSGLTLARFANLREYQPYPTHTRRNSAVKIFQKRQKKGVSCGSFTIPLIFRHNLPPKGPTPCQCYIIQCHSRKGAKIFLVFVF